MMIKTKKKTSELTDSATKEFSRYSSLPTVSEKRKYVQNKKTGMDHIISHIIIT